MRNVRMKNSECLEILVRSENKSPDKICYYGLWGTIKKLL